MADPHPSNDNLYGDVESSAKSTYSSMLEALVAHGGGSGGGGSVLEYRVGRLEADVSGIQSSLSEIKESLARIDTRTADAPTSRDFGRLEGRIPGRYELHILAIALVALVVAIMSAPQWIASDTSGASPAPQQPQAQSAPRPKPSGNSSETPAPADSDANGAR